ncbi:hypothetical protein [Atlantibacter hermannii]
MRVHELIMRGQWLKAAGFQAEPQLR